MSLIYVIGLWLGSWVLIIMIHAIAVIFKNSDVKRHGEDYLALLAFPKNKKEMVKDGNNLFSTGLIYIIGSAISYYVNSNILSWVIIIIGVLFCLPPVLSLLILVRQAFKLKNKYITLSTITAIIAGGVPLLIAINIYFLSIRVTRHGFRQ